MEYKLSFLSPVHTVLDSPERNMKIYANVGGSYAWSAFAIDPNISIKVIEMHGNRLFGRIMSAKCCTFSLFTYFKSRILSL